MITWKDFVANWKTDNGEKLKIAEKFGVDLEAELWQEFIFQRTPVKVLGVPLTNDEYVALIRLCTKENRNATLDDIKAIVKDDLKAVVKGD